MTITPNKWELDVQGYLNVCNITDATPRKQIRDFSAGVNDLGLWNSMVCWPLRSSQNYGSGTTAFSLGGLGTYNGTLVNGPSWGADGITFVTGNSQTITIGNIPNVQPDIMLAHVQAATSGNLRPVTFNYGGVGIGTWAGFDNGYYWDVRNASSGITLRVNGGTVGASMQFNHGVASSSGSSFFVNGTQILTSATAAALAGSSMSNFKINDNSGNGQIAFVLYANSVSASSFIYNLYKSTLGTGLSLP